MCSTSCTRESCTRGLVHRGYQFRLRVFSKGLGSSPDLYQVIRDDEMICVMRVISNVKVYGRPLLNWLGNLCLTIGILWSSVGFNTQIIYHLMVQLNFSYSCTVMVQRMEVEESFQSHDFCQHAHTVLPNLFYLIALH